MRGPRFTSFLSVCLSVYPSVHHTICPSHASPSVRPLLSVSLSVCPYVHQTVCPYPRQSIRLSALHFRPSDRLSLPTPVHPSVCSCLSVCLSVNPPITRSIPPRASPSVLARLSIPLTKGAALEEALDRCGSIHLPVRLSVSHLSVRGPNVPARARP
jgi:hypothetical protein